MKTAPTPSATKPTCTRCRRPFSRWQLTRNLGSGLCADCSQVDHYVVQGSRPMAVTCERCGHKYQYLLEREATGSTEAEAAEKLRSLLERECDVVPCPACRRLNQRMIRQQAANRQAGVLQVLAGLAMCGVVYLVSVACGRIYYGVGFLGAFAVVTGLKNVFGGKPGEF